MSAPTLVPPGQGELVGDSPERRVEILSDQDSLHATWSRFGPHRDGADLHIHRRHTDLFYVLDGELTVRLGFEEEVVVEPRTLVRVPPLVVHGFRNAGDREVRYLNFHAPGQGFADFMRALRDGRTLSYDQEPPPADGPHPAAHAVVGRGEPLADVGEIGIAETSMEPGTASDQPHLHDRHVESFYVLEGQLDLTAGGRDLHAPAGSWIQVPRGVAHMLSPPRSEGVRFLNVHTPNCGFGASDRRPAG